MDRFRQRQQAEHNREKVQQERYRGDLLRAISHDLRTPLSGIMGSAEILMDQLPKESDNYLLARDIFRDADWLKALVENILNLTKLHHLTPNEYQLLTLLARSCGKVLTTGTILSEIWGKNYGTVTQALRALMAGLRRKLEVTPAKPRYIITEVGVGYRLVDE